MGWTVLTAWHKETFGPDGLLGRENKSEVILHRHLKKALSYLNPGLPATAYDQAIAIISQKVADKTLGKINKEKYGYLKNGVPVSFTNAKGELVKKKLKVFDFNNYEDNEFIAASTGFIFRRRSKHKNCFRIPTYLYKLLWWRTKRVQTNVLVSHF